MGESRKGKKLSQEHRRKVVAVLRENPPDLKGKWSGSLNPNFKTGVTLLPGYLGWKDKQRRIRKLGNEGAHTFLDWHNLKEKFNGICLRCGKREPNIKLTQDHIIPLRFGGRNDIGNIQPLCLVCNVQKRLTTTDYRPFATLS